ncbi:MAG: hypothetical protein E5299_02401 [Burkholderia gladioli]|nr:MAG: hypothetical protein E5299_02401 [Burkholderia gladioli]
MRKDIHKKGEPKARYRVKNWAAYNDEDLINRGNVTIWIDEAVLARIPDAIPTRGRPCLYGDTPDSGITWREDRLSTDLARPARFHPKSARFGLPEHAGAELHHALSPGKNA